LGNLGVGVWGGVDNYKELGLRENRHFIMRSGRIPTTIIRNSINKSILIYDEQPKYSLIWLHGLGGEA
jgi:hypothetical protein